MTDPASAATLHGRSLSHFPADTSEEVLSTTVGSVLRAAASTWPDQLALVHGVHDRAARRTWTYTSLLADAEQCAAALLQRFRPGAHVAVWAPNIPEWVILEYGAGLAGLVLVTVNPAYRPAELAFVLRQSGAVGIVMTPEYRSPMRQYLEEVRSDLPALREVIFFTEWDEFLATGGPPIELPQVRAEDLVQIQYTSGTTGFPKGAMLHHKGVTNNARFFARRLGLRPGDVYLNPMPLFHTAGCMMGVLGVAQSGAAHVVMSFDATLVLDLIESERATSVAAVPSMVLALLDHPDRRGCDLSSLRAVISGGTVVQEPLARRIEAELSTPLSIAFGTTECSPLLSMTAPGDNAEDRVGTLGRPLPQTEVRITDPVTGVVQPIGAIGELCCRGYLVMLGYYRQPDATAAAIDEEGWYHTGDLASLDERGFLRVEGRIKDMIIRGGENVYPREVEERLLAHPGVVDVAVVGVPDARWGEVVAAFIRSANETPGVDQLHAWCRETLSGYKTPTVWRFLESFPLTSSGKIQKFALRDLFSSELPE